MSEDGATAFYARGTTYFSRERGTDRGGGGSFLNVPAGGFVDVAARLVGSGIDVSHGRARVVPGAITFLQMTPDPVAAP